MLIEKVVSFQKSFYLHVYLVRQTTVYHIGLRHLFQIKKINSFFLGISRLTLSKSLTLNSLNLAHPYKLNKSQHVAVAASGNTAQRPQLFSAKEDQYSQEIQQKHLSKSKILLDIFPSNPSNAIFSKFFSNLWMNITILMKMKTKERSMVDKYKKRKKGINKWHLVLLKRWYSNVDQRQRIENSKAILQIRKCFHAVVPQSLINITRYKKQAQFRKKNKKQKKIDNKQKIEIEDVNKKIPNN